MSTIYDYLVYYQHAPLTQVPWNTMDDLICALLAYLPIPNFERERSFGEVAREAVASRLPKISDRIAPDAKRMIRQIQHSRRYQDMTIANFVNLLNDQTQFGALTCRLGKLTMVSFKGSNGTVISWLENYRLFCQYPTYTHRLASDYLTSQIRRSDRQIRVVGHSKGGHLAMSSVMAAPISLARRVVAIVSFDGPGFRRQEFESPQYQRTLPKFVNYVPNGSYVGALLHGANEQVVYTDSYAFGVHYPTKWEIFGQYFVPARQIALSKKLHEITTLGLDGLDETKLAEVIDASFTILGKDKAANFDFKPSDLVNFYQNAKAVDLATFRYLKTVAGVIFKLQNHPTSSPKNAP